jgi:membrane-associated protease RseP (regulator of RpoE activity)
MPPDSGPREDVRLEPELRPPPVIERAPVGRPWVHVALFLVTFASAAWAYLVPRHGSGYFAALWDAARDPEQMHAALMFASVLMSILLAHEMGHWFTARLSGVDQSLPYFIPAPTLVGTLGAVILMRSEPPNRSVLLRVAVMGPFLGLALALPALAYGLAHSNAVSESAFDPDRPFIFGSSLLFAVVERLFAPEAARLELHPVAFAGWVGLFVTSLNLIPASQLDGGHVAYALFGARHRRISAAVVVGLFVLGLFVTLPSGDAPANWGGAVWIAWALILFVIGMGHPPVRDDARPLGLGERFAGWLALALFVLTFIPVPVTVRTAWRAHPPAFDEQTTPSGRPAEEFKL